MVKRICHFTSVHSATDGRIFEKECCSLAKAGYEVYFHDPELLRFALKLKSQGKKVIFDSHEFYGYQIKEKEYLPRFFRYIVGTVYMWFETFVCKRIDAVIQVCSVCGQNYF